MLQVVNLVLGMDGELALGGTDLRDRERFVVVMMVTRSELEVLLAVILVQCEVGLTALDLDSCQDVSSSPSYLLQMLHWLLNLLCKKLLARPRYHLDKEKCS